MNGVVSTTYLNNNLPLNFVSVPSIKIGNDKKNFERVRSVSARSKLKKGFMENVIRIFSNQSKDNFAARYIIQHMGVHYMDEFLQHVKT